MIEYLIILVIILILFVLYYLFRITEKFEDKDNKNSINLVMVTSVIHTANKPLTYSSVRSVFTPEDRINQTLNTFRTIREKIPNSFIVLVEGSTLDDHEKNIIIPNVNAFFQCNDLDNINSSLKGLGETSMVREFLNSDIFKNISNKNIIITTTKITGRYYLDDNYSFENMPLDKITLKMEGEDWHVTSSYRVGTNLIDIYKSELDRVYNMYKNHQKNMKENDEISLEKVMFWEVNSDLIFKIRHPSKYGVTGLSSADGTTIESFVNN
jgi:hypothetical protein